MNATVKPALEAAAASIVPVAHVIKGETVFGADVEFRAGEVRFAAPTLQLNALTWPRTAPGPAFDVKLSEILDLLVATGEALRRDEGGLLSEAADRMAVASPYDRGIVDRSYEDLPHLFVHDHMMSLIEGELGDPAVLDGWRPYRNKKGETGAIRAFPPRLVHVLAGNAPGVAAISIIRGAITKGVHLLKLPSNDLFTATAILRTMAAVAPDHPVVRSFCAAYWRGGDATVEGVLFRPQFFDKLVAWGGESAIRSAKNYIGPGFELVAFDPKNSISFVGREALASKSRIAETAALAATDASAYNQSACVASRFQFVEGDEDAVDQFCAALQAELGVERRTSSVYAQQTPGDLREEIESLREFDSLYRVWGGYEGKGLVVRSDEPVGFYPDGKIVNVVRVPSLKDAVRYANVSTQTVGVYPPERKVEVRDALASAGVQRVVTLGDAMGMVAGMSHDGFFPLHRMVRWVNDER